MTEQFVTTPTAPTRAGFIGFALGGAALLLVLITFVAGPFAPQQSVGVSLGDIAAEAGKATLRNWLGMEQPAAEAPAWTIDRILRVVSISLAVFAVLCGAFGYFRRERRDIAAWAVGLGSSAMILQFFSSALMIILGVVIICALIYALGDFLSIG